MSRQVMTNAIGPLAAGGYLALGLRGQALKDQLARGCEVSRCVQNWCVGGAR